MLHADRQCAWGEEPAPESVITQLERALRCAVGCGCGVHAECSELALESLVAALDGVPPAAASE